MAANDYGFSEDLIVETKVIDKDKHGFVRVTDATGGNNSIVEGNLSHIIWMSNYAFITEIVTAKDENLHDACMVYIGITPFQTAHNSTYSIGDIIIDEMYDALVSEYGLDTSTIYNIGTIKDYCMYNAHLYESFNINSDTSNPDSSMQYDMSNLIEDDPRLTRIDDDDNETMCYYLFDFNIVITRMNGQDELLTLIDTIHCRTKLLRKVIK